MKLVELAFFTDDVDTMTQFFSAMLGTQPDVHADSMATFRLGEVKLFIHRRYTPGEGDPPPENHMAFAVDDVDATCTQLVARGLTLEVPPKDYYWGRSAYLRDPDNRQIEITRPAPDDE